MGFISAPVNLGNPGPIGGTTPSTGDFTTLDASNGTITTSTPAFTLSQTWNSAGVTFTALRANVTDTASASGSLLMDLQVGGTSKLQIDKAGNIIASVNSSLAGLCIFNTFTSFKASAGQILITSNGASCGAFGTGFYYAQSTGGLGISSDVLLYRDAAGTLAQRNGTNAQTFRIYNTYTDASNYERGFFRWSSNVLEIGAEAAGTGTQRQLRFPLGTITASTPLSITQTWNSAGVTFTGIQANITDTASASGSLLMDLQVGGVSMMKVSRTGILTLNSGGSFVVNSGASQLRGVQIGADGITSYTATTPAYWHFANTGIIEQRNSTNAQTLRLYRTYTDASNYERLGFIATRTTRFAIAAENAGTGAARSLEISFYTSASDPTSTDITSGCFSVWKNSGTGTIKLWANDGGTMKSVALA